MKKIKLHDFYKKIALGILTVAVLVSAVCLVTSVGKEVKVSQEGYFTVVQCTGDKVKEVYGTDPQLSTETEDMLFAGWFEDQACTIPVTEVDASATYYAKYLDPSVLSIKLQVKTNDDNTTDMRVVSSVDSLNYSGAGFDVYYGEQAQTEEKAIEFTTTTVFERINAKTSGVAYKFSPKVVDADSEYFVTGTIKKIAAAKAEEDFYIKPFWITMDGVKVYGEGRYLSAKNGTDTTNINVPVKVSANPADSDGNVSVTVGGTTKTAKVAAYKDGWAHLNIPVDNKATMASATKVEIANGSAVYRNYQNTSVSSDTTWYDVDPTANEFIIASKADWEGFASIVNGNTDTFKDDTVILVSDLTLNEGTVDVANGTFSGTASNSTQIGVIKWASGKVDTTNAIPFDGTFEGDDNTISGFYCSTVNKDNNGMFQYVGPNGTLQNFNLSNCYMLDTSNGWRKGLLTCALSGSVDNVQIDETNYVKTGGRYAAGFSALMAEKAEQSITNSSFEGYVEGDMFVGGFIGQLYDTTTMNIENCWNDGTVVCTESSGTDNLGRFVGGFAGDVYNGTVTFKDCLNTGSVSTVLEIAGGFVGRQITKTYYENCVDMGSIQSNATERVGAIAGNLLGGQNAYIKNVYTLNNRTNKNGSSFVATASDSSKDTNGYGYYGSGRIEGLPEVITAENLAGANAYINTELALWTPNNTDAVWVATANGPELKQFSTAEAITDFSGLQREATGWYYEEYVNGVAEDGTTYSIDNVDDMYGFTKLSATDDFEKDTVKLTASLDFNPGWTASNGATSSTKAWTPVGCSQAFKGTFDGNSQTISGLYTNRTEGQNGLFGEIESGATVKNITLSNSLITTNGAAVNHKYFAGAIVGLAKGNVDSIYVKSDVTVQTNLSYVGGVVGQWNGNGTISNCWFAGNVISRDIGSWGLAGGIVGGLCEGVTSGVMKNCLNSGTITCNSWTAGGLLGGTRLEITGGSFTIKDCVNVGTVTSEKQTSWFGSVIGGLESSETTCKLENVYTTTDAKKGSTVLTTDMEGIGKIKSNTVYGIVQKMTTSQISGNAAHLNTELDLYSTSNTSGVWAATAGGAELKKFTTASVTDSFTGHTVATNWYYKSYVNGSAPSAATTYQIQSAEEMYGFSKVSQTDNFSGDAVELTKSVNMNSGWSPTQGVAAATSRLTPIGQSTQFVGTFNGNNNTISGLAISGGDADANGLFGRVGSTGIIKNLKLENSYIQVRTSKPDESNVNSRPGWWTGAIVGRFAGTQIDSVYVGKAVTVDTDVPYAGGIVGNWNSTSTISQCWFAGKVLSNVGGTNNYAGGIVGGFTGSVQGGIIENCLNSGSITADSWHGGGIIGGAKVSNPTVTIRHCVNTGSVTSTGNATYFGSVLGGLETDSSNTIHIDEVYTTTDAKRDSKKLTTDMEGIGRIKNNTIYGNVLKYTSDFLTGENAYMNTNLDLYSTSNTDGVWAATSSGPELKKFTTKTVVDTFNVFKADTSWFPYTNTVNGVSTQKSFTITTKEELFGFANLSQSNNFAGVTITLGNNITVNASGTADADKVQWHPIGRTHEIDNENAIHGYRFAGTFNGNNKTISGLYMKKEFTYMAMFAGTEVGSTVKNLRIKDSYFEQLYVDPRGQVASVVADCRGNLDNIYSNATLVTNNYNAGGLVAWANAEVYSTGASTTATYKNCWFDGTIESGINGKYVGGIASAIRRGRFTFENCLFSGTINSKYEGTNAYVGGMTGTITHETSVSGDLNTLALESCISAGKITDANKGVGVGALVGRLNWVLDGDTPVNWTKLTLSNVFAAKDCYGVDVTFPWHKNADQTTDYAISDTLQFEGRTVWTHGKDRLMGYCTEIDLEKAAAKQADGGGQVVRGLQKLDFTNDFAMVNSGVPIPKTMTDLVSSSTLTTMSDLNYRVGFSYMGTVANGWDLAKAENAGMGNYFKKMTGATKSSHYDGYITEMTTNRGYTKYADNSAGTADDDGVYNTILVNNSGDWVISVTYFANISELTLSISTVGSAGVSNHLISSTSDSLRNSSASGNVTFTLSQLPLDSSGTRLGGNQLFFQLPNGHFVINDGAHAESLETLVNKLETLSTAKGLDKIYVDAWIISHQHSDHSGFLTKLWQRPDWASKFVVEGFYISEPADAVFQTEDYYTWRMGGVDGVGVVATDFRREAGRQYNGINILKNASGARTPIYRIHTGERYYFNGLTMDVIFTQEHNDLLETMEYNNNNPDSRYNGNTTSGYGLNTALRCEGIFNSSSSTVLFTTNGGQKIYIGGDSTYVNHTRIVKAYDTCGIKEYFHNGTNADGLKYLSVNSSLGNYQKGMSHITGAKTSQTLSNIDIMVALHHGMNTIIPYYRYLALAKGANGSSSSASLSKFDALLYPSPTIRVYNKNISNVLSLYEYSEDEAQWGGNDWVVNNLVTNKKVYTYNAGDVVVTFSGSSNSISQ